MNFGDPFNELFCCDCFYDEVYFLLRQKKDYEIFEERFSKVRNCYFDYGFATIIIVCHDILKYLKKKYKLSKTGCTESILTKDIHLCSLCTIDLINKIDILHDLRLK